MPELAIVPNGILRGIPLVCNRCLFRDDERVARWLEDYIDVPLWPCTAIGVVDSDGILIGGVAYTDLKRNRKGEPLSVSVSAAGKQPGWVGKERIKILLRYPFIQLGCWRVDALAAVTNRRSQAVIKKLGFRREGRIRSAYGKGKDAVLFSMLRHECRWL